MKSIIIAIFLLLTVTAANANWTAHTNKNALGEEFHYAVSDRVGTVDAHMGAPYRDSEGRILVTCTGIVEFRFDEGHLQEGIADYVIDDGKIQHVTLSEPTQDFSYAYSPKLIKDLRSGNTITI